VQEYVQTNYPNKYIQPDDPLNLYFSNNSLIDPWVELTLEATKSLRPYIFGDQEKFIEISIFIGNNNGLWL
jgi:hypothetical protein